MPFARRARELVALPEALLLLPERGVDGVRIRRIEEDVVAPGVLVTVQHLLERRTTVGGTEDPSFFVGSVGVTQNSHEKTVGVGGIDHHIGNHLAITQAQVRPGRPGIVDLYMPSPVDRSGRMMPAPLPT